jgi:hypothetical protein
MNTCHHTLTDEEADYYFIQYPDVLNKFCGGNKNNRKCARDHWKKHGCKEGKTYQLPDSCNYTLTDEEAICYLATLEKQNSGFKHKPIGNDLNKVREHWKKNGCIHNLKYKCPKTADTEELKRQLKVSNHQLNVTNHQLNVTNHQMKDLGTDYKNYVDKSETQVKDILKLEVTSMPFVFNSVQSQNKVLQTQLNSANGDKLTHSQGAFYGEIQNENLNFYNTVLFWIYYIVVFIFTGVLFGMKQNILFYTKIYILIFFLLFPYFIYQIEYILWFIYHYAVSFLYSKIFTS